MVNKITPDLIKIVKEIESLFISESLDKLPLINATSRIGIDDLKKVIKEYGGKVTERPLDTIVGMEIIRLENTESEIYCIDYDLYFNGQHSDLTLSIEITKTDGIYTTSIEDLHIL
jgi:hypothetical protein